MAFIGSIIKSIIDISDSFTTDASPVEEQQEVLKNLLDKAKNTQFGQQYSFSALLQAEDLEKTFAKNIPFFDYNSLNEQWWQKIHDGEIDVTWPGTPDYFAL